MTEFELLIERLLEQKPEFSRSDIEERIKHKKAKIGAGYLTDQGALFLIASDLGVSLSEPLKVEIGLKDLFVGAKEVSLESRVLSLAPAKQYTRKDGSPFILRTMTVYDNDSTANVKLWDEKANLPEIEELRPGDLIKIIKAYVKSDLNGKPTINIGSGSHIEPSHNESSIPSIDNITIDATSVKEGDENLVVFGKIVGMISLMEFTNYRGQSAKALKLKLRGSDGNSIRVVLWGKDESSVPKVILPDAKVRLLGVRTKQGNQGLEIHGNESTILEIEGKQEAEPIQFRIISATKLDSGKTTILGVDKQKRLYNISDSSENTLQFKENDVLECMPSKVFGNSITLDESSFVRKVDNDFIIPNKAEIRTKIADIKVDGNYYVEAIILKIPERRQVQTKNGDLVLLSKMYVEDDSGQIWIKGWRNQARLIDNCSIGEVISVTGVNAKLGLEGRIELFLSPFSTISKKN